MTLPKRLVNPRASITYPNLVARRRRVERLADVLDQWAFCPLNTSPELGCLLHLGNIRLPYCAEHPCWKDATIPKHFPKEFKDNVVRMARSGKFTYEEVAHDFQISVLSLKRWLEQANIDDGLKEGLTSTEQDEVVRLRRDNRRLVMETEILRRAAAYFAKDAPQNEVPAGSRTGR